MDLKPTLFYRSTEPELLEKATMLDRHNLLDNEAAGFPRPAVMAAIVWTFQVIREVFHPRGWGGTEPGTLEAFFAGFALDSDPEYEVKFWLALARTYEAQTRGRELSPEQKEDMFRAIHSILTVLSPTRLLDLDTGELQKEVALGIPERPRTFSRRRFEQVREATIEVWKAMGGLAYDFQDFESDPQRL